MAGTVIGGQRAAESNKKKDPDFYKRIGSIGGKNGTKGGFYGDKERARKCGASGGTLSKRGYKYIKTENGFNIYIEKESGMTRVFPVNVVKRTKRNLWPF